jgi:hypothetical protein
VELAFVLAAVLVVGFLILAVMPPRLEAFLRRDTARAQRRMRDHNWINAYIMPTTDANLVLRLLRIGALAACVLSASLLVGLLLSG